MNNSYLNTQLKLLLCENEQQLKHFDNYEINNIEDEKNAISHRGRAFRELLKKLESGDYDVKQ